MLGRTHLAIGVIFLFVLVEYTNFIVGTEIPAAILILIGSLLPDIDTAKSIIGRRVKIISWLVRHRGFFHSIFAMISFTVVIQLVFQNQVLSICFLAAYGLHLLTDSITKEGTYLFYPGLLHIKGPLKVGSWVENVIYVKLIIIALVVLL